MYFRVAVIKTDVSEELITSIIRVSSVFQLLVTANDVPSALSLSTLIMEAIESYDTTVLTPATLRHIAEADGLHSHRRANFRSYRVLPVSCIF
jgi:hypothetical protein